MSVHRVATAFFVLYLVFLILASALWRTPLWGLSSWAFVSIEAGLACAVCALIFLGRNISGRLLKNTGSQSRHAAVKLVVFLVATFLILWGLRMRHDLWGERYAATAALKAGNPVRDGAPLASALNYALFRILNGIFLLGRTSSSALLSVAGGVCYVATAWLAARMAFGDDENRKGLMAIGVAMLIANGFFAVFFGTGGATPVAACAAFLFIISALYALREKTSHIVPAILLVIAVYSHYSALYLLPGWIYLITRIYRSNRHIRVILEALGIFILCGIALDFIFSRISGESGFIAFVAGSIPRIFESARQTGWGGLPIRLLEAGNGLLLAGPASVAALVAIATGRGKGPPPVEDSGRSRFEERFLLICAACGVILFLAGAGLLQGGLRWEIFAAAGPSFAVYLLWTLKRRIPDAAAFNRTAVLIVALGVVHILPWIILNARDTAAEERLLTLPLEPGTGELILGERALDAQEFEKAETWFMKSADMDSLNHRAYYRLGNLKMKKEKHIEAVQYYSKAYRLKPDNTEYRFRLAESFIGKRWFEEANYHLEELTESYPDSVRFWKRLGFARNHGGMFEQAIAAYEQALELEPDVEQNVHSLVSAFLNRGAQLQKDGDFEEARILYARVIRLLPSGWRAFNNLATIEMKLENYAGAYDILENALEFHPYASSLNFNMGIVLEKLGRDREALEYLRRSADLDPLASRASEHIGRIENKLRELDGE